MADELTDSQLLDAARQMDLEVRSKQTAAAGIREYIQSKQKLAKLKQEIADHQSLVLEAKQNAETVENEHKRMILALDQAANDKQAKIIAAHNELTGKLDAELEQAKAQVAQHQQSAANANQQAKLAAKNAEAAYKERVAVLNQAEAEKIARNDALDKEFQELSESLNALKKRHGIAG